MKIRGSAAAYLTLLLAIQIGEYSDVNCKYHAYMNS
mgnify:CR=1 FL=1